MNPIQDWATLSVIAGAVVGGLLLFERRLARLEARVELILRRLDWRNHE